MFANIYQNDAFSIVVKIVGSRCQVLAIITIFHVKSMFKSGFSLRKLKYFIARSWPILV